ncbi:MAG: DNA primase small subunit domain-containing protein [archaeon]
MYKEEIEKYYSRPEILKAMTAVSEDREVAQSLASGGFGKRPNAVFYEQDLKQMVKQGAISFHCSVERWKNPLALSTAMRKEDLDKNRIGWDLIIDIDCDHGLEYSKKAAIIICDTLEKFEISSYGIKFSGNRGFHIGVPFESFPASITGIGNIEKQYPRVPKIIIEYLSSFIEKDLRAAFGQDPKNILKLDAAVAASRHMFRMPYSLHQKTWLASMVITREQLKNFTPEDAKPKNIRETFPFLKFDVPANEAIELLRSAIFWDSRREKAKPTGDLGEFKVPENAIPPAYFPPCISNILKGLEDGKKRSIFVLSTFLHNIGWKKSDIIQMALEWNKKNKPPIEENIIVAGINHQYTRKAPQMAPNCKNPGFYDDYNVCTPDEFCKTIQNPVTYTLGKAKRAAKKGRRGKRKRIQKQGNKSTKTDK